MRPAAWSSAEGSESRGTRRIRDGGDREEFGRRGMQTTNNEHERAAFGRAPFATRSRALTCRSFGIAVALVRGDTRLRRDLAAIAIERLDARQRVAESSKRRAARPGEHVRVATSTVSLGRTKFQRPAETAAYTVAGKYMQAIIICREGPRSLTAGVSLAERRSLSNTISPRRRRQTLGQQVEQTIVIVPDFAFVMHADERGCSNAGGQASPATIGSSRARASRDNRETARGHDPSEFGGSGQAISLAAR